MVGFHIIDVEPLNSRTADLVTSETLMNILLQQFLPHVASTKSGKVKLPP
jgi:hypothetical protein